MPSLLFADLSNRVNYRVNKRTVFRQRRKFTNTMKFTVQPDSSIVTEDIWMQQAVTGIDTGFFIFRCTGYIDRLLDVPRDCG